MISNRVLTATRHLSAARSTLAVGVPLAFLWASHAAANYLPGTGYLRLPILFAMAAALLAWRVSTPEARTGRTNNSGMTVGLCCWFIAATLSTILNWKTDDVILTYVVVFLAGGAVFFALSGITCTPAALEIAVVGLVIGTLFPLIGGLRAFTGEWGAPDVATTITAWRNIARMNSYTDATFGNRGNTAGFLVIVTPILFAMALDGRRRVALRVLCATTLIPIALNLMILQIRSAFVTLFIALMLVSTFKLGLRRLPLLLGALVLGWVLLFKLAPDVGVTMTERIVPAITVDTDGDESVQGRADAIREGARIFSRNWLLGIGPGGALTIHSMASAHQFQVQEAMETGLLGLVGSLLLSIGVFISLIRTVVRGRRDELNDTRFSLLIGPASFVMYAIIANAAFTNGSVNTWVVLTASMLALAPGFDSAPSIRSLVSTGRRRVVAPLQQAAPAGTAW